MANARLVKKRAGSSYTFDPAKVKSLAARGLNCKEISAVVGVDQSSIWRYLDKVKVEAGQIKRYTEDRADILARIGGRVAGLIEAVTDTLQDDIDNGVLASCKPTEKLSMLRDLSVVSGIVHDKERLERGQSTANVSLIARMMGSALKDAGKSPAPSEGAGQSTPADPTSSGDAPRGQG